MLEIFALLVFGHFVADYPLQNEFMALGKNRFKPICGAPWYHLLTAHAVIHGGIVGIIAGTLWLGVAEAVVHWVIDYSKCAGKFGYHTDQALHILCKLLWVGILML